MTETVPSPSEPVSPPAVVSMPARAGRQSGSVVLGEDESFTITLVDRGARLADVGRARHGEVRRRDARSVTYRPPPGFSGDDDFTYTVVDAAGRRLPATVSLSVEAPERKADAPRDPEETGGPLLAVSEEARGTLALSADGDILYTPPEDFVGVDRFRFRVRTPGGEIRAGQVTAWVDANGEVSVRVREEAPGNG